MQPYFFLAFVDEPPPVELPGSGAGMIGGGGGGGGGAGGYRAAIAFPSAGASGGLIGFAWGSGVSFAPWGADTQRGTSVSWSLPAFGGVGATAPSTASARTAMRMIDIVVSTHAITAHPVVCCRLQVMP